VSELQKHLLRTSRDVVRAERKLAKLRGAVVEAEAQLRQARKLLRGVIDSSASGGDWTATPADKAAVDNDGGLKDEV
jgi:outer membrane protein TolC